MGYLKKKKKLGFWAGDENNFQFVQPLMDGLAKEYEIKKFYYHNEEEVLKAQLESVDLGWFEWGNGPVIPASHMHVNTPIINRIHRYEIYSDAPRLIEWRNVERLIFSSPSMIKKFDSKFREESKHTQSELVEIGVNLKLFKYHSKPITGEIIYVGRIHPHKNPSLLLQIFSKVHSVDPDFKLTIIGKFADELYEEYFLDQIQKLGLKYAVSVRGFLSHDEIVESLQKADFFLLPSVIEGLSQAVLEAMACGVRPVVSNYYGAEAAFERKFIFNTVDEAADKILNSGISRSECSELVHSRYDIEVKNREVGKIIKEIIGS